MEDVFLSVQWSRFPLKKLKISSLLKNVPIYYGVRSVITVFVRFVIELYSKPDASTSKLHILIS